MAERSPCETLKQIADLVVGMAEMLIMQYKLTKNEKEKKDIRYKVKYLQNIYGQIGAAWTSAQFGCGGSGDLPSFPSLPFKTEAVEG
jgi:hypothetical protein